MRKCLCASNVFAVSASQIIATSISKPYRGNYQLTVSTGTTPPPCHSRSFGGAPQLVTHLIVPSEWGATRPQPIYVQYANVGQVSMPAPLFSSKGHGASHSVGGSSEHPIIPSASFGEAEAEVSVVAYPQQSTLPTGVIPLLVLFLRCRSAFGHLPVQRLKRDDPSFGSRESPGILQPGDHTQSRFLRWSSATMEFSSKSSRI